tara:strand:- start:1159 stop:1635 length:477 start_codon:yes stop_codon:yes gene_type:complete
MKNFYKKLSLLFFTVIISIPVLGQSSKDQKKSSSYHDFETECLENTFDGSYIFYSWGKGSNKNEAIDQAKRNVLNDIFFKGVNKGCKLNPLIIDVNGEYKYKSYIYSFFQKDYNDFVTIEKSPKNLFRSEQQTTYGVKVRINRETLKQKLIKDNIISK